MNSTDVSPLRKLFRGIWSVTLFIYRSLLVLSLVVTVGAIWFALQHRGGGMPVQVEDNVALAINPVGDLVDTLDQDPSQLFIDELSGEGPSQVRVRDLTEALEAAAKDPRIALAVLRLDKIGAIGTAQAEEIAAAVKTFRAAGKKVQAWAPYYGQTEYLLAAHADQISVDPFGAVLVEGYAAYGNYIKDALDKLGVQMHVFRVGEYKSAVEPFLRNDMSAEAKQANLEWLTDLWSEYTRTVSAQRKLLPADIERYVAEAPEGLKQAGGDGALYAKNARLVDLTETLEQFRERVGKTVGMDEDSDSFRQVHYSEYLDVTRRERELSQADAATVSMVVVQGEIVDGESEPGLAGGDTVSDLLREARDDDEVRAVVLRVDSPGGSVFASEQIRREVEAIRKAGKPVVVSMSTLAASGGYWISMDADEIWAHETTLTGSIGIFGLLPTLEKPLQKLGIHTDGVGTTPLAGAFRLDRPLSPQVQSLVQSEIEHGYRRFIEGVARGRKLPLEKVDPIARGRVWSGQDAKAIGLVDHFGGLDQAILAAAKRAGIESNYKVEEITPEFEPPIQALLRLFGQGQLHSLLSKISEPLPALQQALHSLRWVRGPRAAYAHCFCKTTPN
ncbi:MAG: signal peptide peptidase SppA [Pseudomonadota bacterium]